MESLEKKKKGGLRKCPIHRFGANYELVEGTVFRCKKCGSYADLQDVPLEGWSHVKISRPFRSIHYKFV